MFGAKRVTNQYQTMLKHSCILSRENSNEFTDQQDMFYYKINVVIFICAVFANYLWDIDKIIKVTIHSHSIMNYTDPIWGQGDLFEMLILLSSLVTFTIIYSIVGNVMRTIGKIDVTICVCMSATTHSTGRPEKIMATWVVNWALISLCCMPCTSVNELHWYMACRE